MYQTITKYVLAGNNAVHRRGFTLTELLVVVLIIGILVAIAIPQYQKSIEKSNMVTGLTLLDSLKKGMDTYLLTNGRPKSANYNVYEALDIELPQSTRYAYSAPGARYSGKFVFMAYDQIDYIYVGIIRVDCDDIIKCPWHYSLGWRYTSTNGWEKQYTMYSGGKVNLAPDFEAMGYKQAN